MYKKIVSFNNKIKQKIFCFIDRRKIKNESFFTQLLKLTYTFFYNSDVTATINIVIPLVFSLLASVYKFKLSNIIIVTSIMLITNLLHSFCLKYKTDKYQKASYCNSILQYVQSIMKSYNESVSDYKFEGLFEDIADMACDGIYHFLKDEFNIEARVSIIQQYCEDDNEYKCVMISRISKNTLKLKKKKDNSSVKYNKKQKYYKKILRDNKDEFIYLNKEDVVKLFSFKNTNQKNDASSVKIEKYICIPQKTFGEKIAFLLQIDIMNNPYVFDSKEKSQEFCRVYFDSIIRILQNAYLIETCYKNDYKIKGGINNV